MSQSTGNTLTTPIQGITLLQALCVSGGKNRGTISSTTRSEMNSYVSASKAIYAHYRNPVVSVHPLLAHVQNDMA
eukprot:2462748-Amphidinium_carterae.1